jgi:hypothetical protein
MCDYVENVWFDDDEDVRMLCIQLDDYLMMWLLAYNFVMMIEDCYIDLVNYMRTNMNMPDYKEYLHVCCIVYLDAIHVFV